MTRVFCTRLINFFLTSKCFRCPLFLSPHCTLLWAYGCLYAPGSFLSNSLFVHSLVCPITHSFLNGFQPNLYQHFPHVCSTCHTIFSLKKTLERICERPLYCRLIVDIIWTRQMIYINFLMHNLY